ncbi:HD domain-containing protein [Kribbella sp. GL6]|uniref:HD domain-containing protein n=1 Tax=Kribbella sp. GL6 TaxID=3419765 RepID=UPI003D049DB2
MTRKSSATNASPRTRSLSFRRRLRRASGEAVTEYEAAETIEARCAKDADRLECLMQAVEYGEAGHKRVTGWIESSRARIQTDFGRRLAEAALQTSPLAWRDR